MVLSEQILIILTCIILFIPLITVGIGLSVSSFKDNHDRANRVLGIISIIASALQLVITLFMMSSKRYPLSFTFLSLGFYVDYLSLFFLLLVNGIAFAASWNCMSFLEIEKEARDVRAERKAEETKKQKKEENALKTREEKIVKFTSRIQKPWVFHTLANLFHFTMLLVPIMDNLVGVWIAIELTTLASAFLIAYKGGRDAWEASWKYLIITSTGIVIALLGTMFLSKALISDIPQSATNAVMNWSFLMECAHNGLLYPDFVKLSFLFAVIGFGTKAGLTPMHTWLPDGHGEAPSPISALLSGVLLKLALYAILRYYTLTNAVLKGTTFTSSILLGIGLISLLTAVPFILKDNRFKRILAYHSLEHMGIITFGLGFGGQVTLFGMLLHSLNHALTKALMFLSFGNVKRYYDKYEIKEKAITGVLRNMPITGGILTIGGLALVGAPPFNIFMSEFIILWGILQRLWKPVEVGLPAFSSTLTIIAVILFMISTTLIFYGLVRHLGQLMLGEDKRTREKLFKVISLEKKISEDQETVKRPKEVEKFWRDLFPLLFLSFFVLILGIWIIRPLAELIQQSVAIIMGVQGK